MLCPDVWSFPVVKNNVILKSGNYDEKSKKTVKNIIENHPFNEIVSIILPEQNSISPKIIDLIQDSDHYIVKNLKLETFLQKQFIEGFIKRGKFIALSDCINNEFDNSIAITPNGILILSICKDLYQTLGLEGQPIRISGDKKEKYIIRINLLDPNLRTETKYYERIKKALSNQTLILQTLKFVWNPPTQDICPSSIAKYFNDCGYKVELNQTKFKIHQEFNIKFPKTLNKDKKNYNDEDYLYEFVESIGMCMLSCDMNPDENISSYEANLNFNDINNALVLHCKGFFLPEFLVNLTNEIKDTLESNNAPHWIALHVHGFPLAPLDFFGKVHCFKSNGDNDYLIVLFSNNEYFFYQNVSSNKSIK